MSFICKWLAVSLLVPSGVWFLWIGVMAIGLTVAGVEAITGFYTFFAALITIFFPPSIPFGLIYGLMNEWNYSFVGAIAWVFLLPWTAIVPGYVGLMLWQHGEDLRVQQEGQP